MRVNGAVVTDPATRVDAAADVLEVAGMGRLQLAAPGGPEVRKKKKKMGTNKAACGNSLVLGSYVYAVDDNMGVKHISVSNTGTPRQGTYRFVWKVLYADIFGSVSTGMPEMAG